MTLALMAAQDTLSAACPFICPVFWSLSTVSFPFPSHVFPLLLMKPVTSPLLAWLPSPPSSPAACRPAPFQKVPRSALPCSGWFPASRLPCHSCRLPSTCFHMLKHLASYSLGSMDKAWERVINLFPYIDGLFFVSSQRGQGK